MQRTFTFIELIIAILLITVVAAIAIPTLNSSRRNSNEAVALETLNGIQAAQESFRDRDMENDGAFDYGSLAELAEAGLIDKRLMRTDFELPFGAAATKQGYHFLAETGDNADTVWFALALPVLQGETGDRYFATSQSGIIAFNKTMPVTGSVGFDLDSGTFNGEDGWEAIGAKK